MSKMEEFGKYLHAKYPEIFNDDLWIECGTGWYDLVNDLSREIVTNLHKFGDRYEGTQAITVTQIKEKYGSLRYYVVYDMDDMDIMQFEQIISHHENLSLNICEDCGEAGMISKPDGYWLKVLCVNCLEKYSPGE